MTTSFTPDVEAFATALVSAVVSNADQAVRKTAVIAVFDAYKDKLASDLGATPLELMALDWMLRGESESAAYDALLELAEHLVHQVVETFFGRILPSLEAAIHLS